MGCFTWKFADDGRKKLPYGGKGYIALPDGTFIGEDRYDGYGMFGKYDAYDVVTDMNKEYLKDIFDMMERETGGSYFGKELKDVAAAYQDGDGEALKKAITVAAENQPFIRDEWKRNIGIAIASDEFNSGIPFPLKITSTDKPKKTYAQLKPSMGTQ